MVVTLMVEIRYDWPRRDPLRRPPMGWIPRARRPLVAHDAKENA